MRRQRRPLAIFLFIILLLLSWWVAPAVFRLYYPFPYENVVRRVAQEHQFDPLLLAALIRVESKFDPSAVSRSGARGLMQLMPGTAFWAAENMHIDLSEEDLFIPETNIAIGAWYLGQLRQEFGGDTLVALAAYNGGRGNVRTWLEEGQWDGKEESLIQIPFPETRDFLGRVIADYRMYRYLYPFARE